MKCQVTRCDVCKSIKEDADKWIGVTVHPPAPNDMGPAIWIGMSGKCELDVCSDACLQNLLTVTLGQIKA